MSLTAQMEASLIQDCGDFSAMSVNFTAGVEYTSRLTFTATAALNGTVIECTRSTHAFGNDAIKIGGWYIELCYVIVLPLCNLSYTLF